MKRSRYEIALHSEKPISSCARERATTTTRSIGLYDSPGVFLSSYDIVTSTHATPSTLNEITSRFNEIRSNEISDFSEYQSAACIVSRAEERLETRFPLILLSKPPFSTSGTRPGAQTPSAECKEHSRAHLRIHRERFHTGNVARRNEPLNESRRRSAREEASGSATR